MRMVIFLLLLAACKKDAGTSTPSQNAAAVTGRITDSKGNPLGGIKVTLEHTVWLASYVYATSDNNGRYTAQLPAQPAGSWTAKAQLEKSAYGRSYRFDLVADHTDPVTRDQGAVMNFTWQLSGPRPGGGFYGAHADLYPMGTDVDPSQVKLVFTPVEPTLIDGTPATVLQRSVQDIAGTFMATDIPIGRYTVKAVYPGKTLLLSNRHETDTPAVSATFVFGKYGYLGETEYNIEFWLTE